MLLKQMFYSWLWGHCVVISHRDLSRNEIRVIHRNAFLSLTALTNLWVWTLYCFTTYYHYLYWTPGTYHMFCFCSQSLLCNDCLQRSEYELSDFDSNNWTELTKSVETVRKPTNEKCAKCKKPAKTKVRKQFSAPLSSSLMWSVDQWRQ